MSLSILSRSSSRSTPDGVTQETASGDQADHLFVGQRVPGLQTVSRCSTTSGISPKKNSGGQHAFANERRFARPPAEPALMIRPSSVLGSQLCQEFACGTLVDHETAVPDLGFQRQHNDTLARFVPLARSLESKIEAGFVRSTRLEVPGPFLNRLLALRGHTATR